MKKLTMIFLPIAMAVFSVCVSGCNKWDCRKKPRKNTTSISFIIKDKNTGANLLPFPSSTFPAPDSIKLRNLHSGMFYTLYVSYINDMGVENAILYSHDYNRPAGVADSLVFLFGNSIPDTLRVEVGLVDGWRGDECPSVREAGIKKVTLRNQVLFETEDDQVLIPILK